MQSAHVMISVELDREADPRNVESNWIRSMLNWIGKTSLVSSTIAPVLGALAVNAWSGGEYGAMCWCGEIGLGLTVVSGLILMEYRRRIAVESLQVRRVMAVDQESLAFLIVYLLPLLAKDANRFNGFRSLYGQDQTVLSNLFSEIL